MEHQNNMPRQLITDSEPVSRRHPTTYSMSRPIIVVLEIYYIMVMLKNFISGVWLQRLPLYEYTGVKNHM